MTRQAMIVCAVGACLAACGDETTSVPDAAPPSDAGSDAAAPARAPCNPLSPTDACLLPFPSSYYLRADDTTETGFRVDYPTEAMPANVDGVRIDPTRMNLIDGFGTVTPIVVQFRETPSAELLPDEHEIGASIDPGTPIAVLRFPDGARVPFVAELDADAGNDVPALFIRPMAPLDFNTRYAVVITDGLRADSGGALTSPETFVSMRDGTGVPEALAGEAARIDEVLTFASSQGIAREHVVLAWDFHTLTQRSITGTIVDMVADARERVGASGPAFTITDVQELSGAVWPYVLRRITGEMEVPSYLDPADNDRLRLDAEGHPQFVEMRRFKFGALVPRCAEQATEPISILYYGHGFLGTVDTALDFPWLHDLIRDPCAILVTTDWHGLSGFDLYDLAELPKELSGAVRTIDKLSQAHVNAQMLVRLARTGLRNDAALAIDGHPVTDGSRVIYLGISNGGIQATTFAALSEDDITQFVLQVGGGGFGLLSARACDARQTWTIKSQYYPDSIDRMMISVLSQELWDRTEPVMFAGYVATPAAGAMPKHFLLQEGHNDDHVPNLSTRLLARALHLPLLSPFVEPVFGIDAQPGPLPSAYAQWDFMVEPPSSTNVPNACLDEAISPHVVLKYEASAMDQTRAFLRPAGQVTQTCEGPCDPN